MVWFKKKHNRFFALQPLKQPLKMTVAKTKVEKQKTKVKKQKTMVFSFRF